MTTQALVRRTDLQKSASHIDYILLDASGSMVYNWLENTAAIDAYVYELQSQNINTRITFATFEGERGRMNYQILQECSPQDWIEVRGAGSPGGGTPLYDAINLMGRELADWDPPNCSITIVTDGASTSSATTEEQARQILDWARAKGWQVTLIGCDFNNLSLCKSLGGRPEQCIGVAANRLLEVAKAVAEKRAKYARTGDDIGFDDSEKQQFGGYLSAK